MVSLFSFVLLGGFLLASQPVLAASGLFPKMPPANSVTVVDVTHDGVNARMTAWALEGLINQTGAESYVVSRPEDQQQLAFSEKPSTRLALKSGSDPGVRALFAKFSGRVKKMNVYDPNKDWTFYLALMASAQGEGIPVIAQVQAELSAETGWRGPIEDYRNIGQNRIEAYEWALAHLMPGCTRKVVFVLGWNLPLVDYAAATKGFIFALDFKKPDERAEAEKIFATRGYTEGTSLMGYATTGDDANTQANPYGIGYVVSDLYANGSFWSSFPDKTYHQSLGRPVNAQPGKVYVALNWSDGDNISFDQVRTYRLWRETARTKVPMAISLSPTLQELNSPLLDWYYSKLTPNDELIAGPSGVQFIFGDSYNPNLLPAWCALSRDWMADAGFHTAYVWSMKYPSDRYQMCNSTMNLAGVFHADSNHFNNQAKVELGSPVIDGDRTWSTEQALFDSLASIAPKPNAPTFVNRVCQVQSFGDDGWNKVQGVVDRLNEQYPGRFVYLLPKDFFATIRQYYRLAPAVEVRAKHS